jgi:hypothetical protein
MAEQTTIRLAGAVAGRQYALSVPTAAPAGTVGSTLGRRAGSSLEFQEYRDYQTGDDLRHIDWNAYARSDQLTVKLFREEVTPHADIVVDVSRSMALADTPKAAAAVGVAAFLAAAAFNAGFSVHVWRLAAAAEPIPGGTGLPETWPSLDFDFGGDPALALAGAPWRPRSVRLLVSDLLWPTAPELAVRSLAERAAATAIVQVLAAQDVQPPVNTHVRLTDVESGGTRNVFLDTARVQRYQANLARHQEQWVQACRPVAAVFASVVAETVVRDWRFEPLVAANLLRVA